MKTDKPLVKIPIKISSHDIWMVSEADHLDIDTLKCKIENNILPETDVEVVMMLPCEIEGKKTSKKVSCKGIVQKTDFVSAQPKERSYAIKIMLSDLSIIEKKMITTISEHFRIACD